jgi:hypothetical protein
VNGSDGMVRRQVARNTKENGSGGDGSTPYMKKLNKTLPLFVAS